MRRNVAAVALVALLGMEPAWPQAPESEPTPSTQVEEQTGADVDAPLPEGTDVPTSTEMGLPTDPDTGGEAPVVSSSTLRESMIPSDRPVLELSLAEAIQLTLSNSIATRIRGVERVQALARVEASKAGYDPFFDSGLLARGSQVPTNSGLESAAAQSVQNDIILDASITQNLPVGGNVTVGLNSQRNETNNRFAFLPAQFGSTLSAAVNFPLLRNRGNLSLDQPIEVAEENLSFADLNLRQQIIDAIARTQNDYLDLILAREQLKIQLEGLALAKNQLEISQAQERVGTLAPIEVLSAESEVAAREELVISAESALLQSEDVLRTSLNLPESLEAWDVGIIPTDKPGLPQQSFEFDAAVRRSLESRPDYQQALINLRTLRLNLELSRDQVRPQLDLTGGFGFIGDSQTGLTTDPNGALVTTGQGGIFGSHVESLLSFENFSWNVGFILRQPLGNRAALGRYRVDKLEIERALLSLRDLELNIVSIVRGFLRSIETNRQRVAAARVATELQRRRLEAEQKKFQVGTSTSFDVLLFQERYIRAITVETQAVIDLNRAFLGLQQAVGVTLEVNGIRVENGEAILGEAMYQQDGSNLPVAPDSPPQFVPTPSAVPTPQP